MSENVENMENVETIESSNEVSEATVTTASVQTTKKPKNAKTVKNNKGAGSQTQKVYNGPKPVKNPQVGKEYYMPDITEKFTMARAVRFGSQFQDGHELLKRGLLFENIKDAHHRGLEIISFTSSFKDL